MNIGFHSFYRFYNQNRMFLDASSPIGDDLMHPFVCLGGNLKVRGHTYSTIDMEPLDSYDAIVFFDYPTKLNPYFRKVLALENPPPLYLVLFEPKAIKPSNWSLENHSHFKKIFTSNLEFVDNKKYFWLNIASKIEFDSKYFDASKKTKFCTLIASNKYSNDDGQLYSERIKAIRWFEKYHPDQFDLYGVDWDRLFFPIFGRLNFALSMIYRKMPWLPKWTQFKSYRGRVKSKRATLSQYQFSICFENAAVSGWVTEKIFDCFMAGVIPVYLGAPEVEKMIPAEAYINMSQFSSYEALYNYMSSMCLEDRQKRLDVIEGFLKGPKVLPWGSEFFAETLVREVCVSE